MSQNLQPQINYWKSSAHKNFAAAKTLLQNKHYDAALFFCHLALEKILKALVVKRTKKPAPYLHHLEKLAHLAGVKLTKEQTEYFRLINTFNIAGRYDDAKLAFFKKCTKEYTENFFQITKNLYVWLKKQFPK